MKGTSCSIFLSSICLNILKNFVFPYGGSGGKRLPCNYLQHIPCSSLQYFGDFSLKGFSCFISLKNIALLTSSLFSPHSGGSDHSSDQASTQLFINVRGTQKTNIRQETEMWIDNAQIIQYLLQVCASLL